MTDRHADHSADRIAADYGATFRYLSMFTPPAGHAWVAPADELTWFTRDVHRSTRHGASIYIRRTPADDADPAQLHAELRLFWDRTDDGYPLHRAILWCETGARFAGQNRSLLDENVAHLRSPRLTLLCAAIAETIVPALRRHAAADLSV